MNGLVKLSFAFAFLWLTGCGFDMKAIGVPSVETDSSLESSSESKITGQSTTAVSVALGAPIYLYATLDSSEGVSYQWYKDGVKVQGGTQLNSTRTHINYYYYVAAASAKDVGIYKVVFSDKSGSSSTRDIIVTVAGVSPTPPTPPSFIITRQPNSLTRVDVGGSIYLYAQISSTQGVSFQWYKNGVPVSGGSQLNSDGTLVNYFYFVNSVVASDAGTYRVTFTDSRGAVTSTEAVVQIAERPTPPAVPAPSISRQPDPLTQVTKGGSVYLYAQVSNSTGLSYQWYKNGAPVQGGSQLSSDGNFTNYYFWVGSATEADAGTYKIVFTNAGGSVTSNNAVVKVGSFIPAPAPAPTPAPTPAPAPAPTPNSGTLLGACGSCVGGPPGIPNVNSMATYLNAKEDYVMVWGWGPTINDFTYSFQFLSALWPANYKLLWSMPMLVPGMTFNQIAAGQYDSVYKNIAQTMALRNPDAIIRLGHEMNGNWYPWSVGGPAGDAAGYAAAFRRIVTVMRSVEPNLKFDWCPNWGSYLGNDAAPTYPGDAYVDFISLDIYDDNRYFTGTPEQRWNWALTKDGRSLNWIADFARAHGKRLAIDEWASNTNDGTFIRYMHAWMKQNNVHHQMYWNSNEGSFTGSFGSQPYNGVVYKELFGH